ncbi:hypothetical protein HMPREF3190_00341 [Umbribacter vaginalis]|nr:hypothetical protein HMPREF3190_00341 [Coriobacteriales bacterium DNF00809]
MCSIFLWQHYTRNFITGGPDTYTVCKIIAHTARVAVYGV